MKSTLTRDFRALFERLPPGERPSPCSCSRFYQNQRLLATHNKVYYPDPDNVGRYNTDGVRYFYAFATNLIITK